MERKTTKYKVVINQQGQYDMIPADQTLSRGVREAGMMGDKTTCLNYIEEVWTDMKSSDRDRILRSIIG